MVRGNGNGLDYFDRKCEQESLKGCQASGKGDEYFFSGMRVWGCVSRAAR